MTQFLKFSYSLMIREHHLDTFGHVNNACYLQILEEARWDVITSRGLGLNVIQELKIGPTILEANILFKKELDLRDTIHIESQLTSYEGRVGQFKQVVFNENHDIACEAIFAIGLFNLETRKLITPTPEWLHAIGAISA